jgi:hypothetical protein
MISSADISLFQEEIVELKSYIEKDEPSAIRAMSNRGGMHVDEFSEAAHDAKDASDVLSYWGEIRYLIWNVLPRLWSFDDSWDNLTMRQRLAELQHKISFMHAHFGCRASSSTRAATLLAPACAQSPADGTSWLGIRGSPNPRLNRRHRRCQKRAPDRSTRGKYAGRKIWEQLIKRVHTPQGPAKVKPDELNRLVNSKLNGRQVSYLLCIQNVLNLPSASDQEHYGNSAGFGYGGGELHALFSP